MTTESCIVPLTGNEYSIFPFPRNRPRPSSSTFYPYLPVSFFFSAVFLCGHENSLAPHEQYPARWKVHLHFSFSIAPSFLPTLVLFLLELPRNLPVSLWSPRSAESPFFFWSMFFHYPIGLSFLLLLWLLSCDWTSLSPPPEIQRRDSSSSPTFEIPWAAIPRQISLSLRFEFLSFHSLF